MTNKNIIKKYQFIYQYHLSNFRKSMFFVCFQSPSYIMDTLSVQMYMTDTNKNAHTESALLQRHCLNISGSFFHFQQLLCSVSYWDLPSQLSYYNYQLPLDPQLTFYQREFLQVTCAFESTTQLELNRHGF